MEALQFAKFTAAAVKVCAGQLAGVFYVYPDKMQAKKFKLPATLEDAYGDGFLTIVCDAPGWYYLEIANQLYTSSNLWELERILFDWAISEGYIF
jgi:hypothetical protein